MRAISIALLAVCLATSPAQGKQHRSTTAKRAFQLEQPCPSTGEHRGKCPGYVIDHIDPLCHGGADTPSNMQWQTIADAKHKDIDERRLCHATYKSVSAF